MPRRRHDERRARARKKTKADDDFRPRVRRPGRDRCRSLGRARLERSPRPRRSHRSAYLRALHDSASAVDATGWAPHFLVLERARRARSPPARSTSRTTPTASTCSTGPGPTPTGATGSSTTRSCVDASRSRRCRARACSRARTSIGCSCCARIEQLARSAKLSSAHLLFLDDADQAAAREAGWSMRTHGAVPLDQPRARALRRLRRLPRQPAAREAQEDPAGATPRRRGRRHVQRGDGAQRSPRPTGTSSTAATPSPTARTLDALPDARFLRPLGGDDGATTGCSSSPGAAASASPPR